MWPKRENRSCCIKILFPAASCKFSRYGSLININPSASVKKQLHGYIYGTKDNNQKYMWKKIHGHLCSLSQGNIIQTRIIFILYS